MADTPRTVAALLTTLFQDGQAAGSISAQDVRDLIVTFESRGLVSVKQYGAIGNGVADDSAAIQAAINAVQSRTNRGTVFFPAGKYKIGTTLTITAGGMRLVGESGALYNAGSPFNGSALVTSTAGNAPSLTGCILNASVASEDHQGPCIENIIFAAETNTRSQVLLNIGNFMRFQVRGCSFRSGAVGVQLQGPTDVSNGVIDSSFFSDNKVAIDELVSTTGAGNNVISNNNIVTNSAGDTGIRAQSGNAQLRIIGNKFDGLTDGSVRQTSIDTLSLAAQIIGNNFEVPGPCVVIPPKGISNDARHTTIVGNTFSVNGLSGTIVTNGTTTNGSASVTGISSTTGILPGMPVHGAGVPNYTYVFAVGVGTVTLSKNATASATVSLTFAGACVHFGDDAEQSTVVANEYQNTSAPHYFVSSCQGLTVFEDGAMLLSHYDGHEGSTPATPASGRHVIYVDSGGALVAKGSSGAVHTLSTA